VIGVFCIPLTILPTVLGIFELIYAAKLFSNPPQAIKPSTNIAVLEIACVLVGNVFSMAVGILALVFYNDTVVKDYFARLNGTLAPLDVVPSAPAPLHQPEAVPPSSENIPAPIEESPAPPADPAEETPARPKRTPRKIAKS
jgi:hypothetical protein